MATLVSTTSGNWSTAGNWTVANTGVVSGAAPTLADEIAIPSSRTVTASGYTANAAAIGASTFVVAAGTGIIPNGAVVFITGTTGMYMVRGGGISAPGNTLTFSPPLRTAVTAGSAIRVYGGTAGSVMTVDNTSCVGGGDVVAAGGALLAGKLQWSRIADSTLTLRSNLNLNLADAELDMGTAASPIPAAYTAILKYDSATPTNGKYGLASSAGSITTSKISVYGAAKTGSTTTTTAIAASAVNPTVRIADATGWVVGDYILCASTTANTPANMDSFVIASLTLVSGTIYDVGMTGTSTFDHASGCPVINSSRNVRPAEPISATSSAFFTLSLNQDGVGAANSIEIRNAEFAYGVQGTSATSLSGFNISGPVASVNTLFVGISGCSFTTLRNAQTVGAGFSPTFMYMQSVPISDCVWSTKSTTLISCNVRQAPIVLMENCVSIGGGLWASISSSQGCQGFTENFCKHYSHSAVVYDPIVNVGRFINDTVFDNCGNIETGRSGSATVYSRCSFGVAYGAVAGSRLVTKLSTLSYAPVEAIDCLFGSAYTASDDVSSPTLMQASDYCLVTNRQADVTQHTLTKFNGITNRDNATAYRSPSAVQLRPTTASVALTNTVNITAVAGTALRVIGYLRYDSNLTGATLPSVTLSGAGSTPATYTQTGAANAWEKFDLTVTPAANGTVTLVTTAVSTSATANVWLSGVCTSPWVSSSRHYGFVPVVGIATQSVDTQISVTNESTVAAYTTLETQAKLYDRLALWGCDNPSSAIFFSQAGGTLNLGSKNLIVDATAASVLVVSGSDVTIKATTLTGTRIVTTGTISFVNGAAPAPSLVYQDVSGVSAPILAPNLINGTRVRIYNVTDSVQLANATAGASGYVSRVIWTADKTVRMTTRYISGVSAKARTTSIGVLTSSGLTFLDTQADDAAYVANGVDGAACDSSSGGEFTADYPNIQVDINDTDNTTSLARIYAWLCYQESTSSGIINFFGAMRATDSANYLIDGSIVDLAFDNRKTALLTIDGGFVQKLGGSQGLVATSTVGAIYFDSGRAYLANAANLPADSATAVWSSLLEGSFSAADIMRINAAVSAGKTSGQPTAPVFRDLNDTVNRIVGTVDTNGNRTAVTVTP
jgi:hypothetical protein